VTILGSMATASSQIQVGGSALSLLPGAKALLFGSDFPPGIAGFLFDIPISEQVRLNAQITDHYTEKNVSGQDHVAFEPSRITLTGLVSELVYSKSAIEAYVQQVIDRLTPLGILSPSQSQSAQRYLSEASRLKSAVTSAVGQLSSLAGMFSGDYGKSNQQKAYITLTTMYENRALITVETPWKTFENMIIENLTFEQDETTKDVSTVTAVFKEIRFFSVAEKWGQLVGRIAAQKADVSDKGPAKGQDSSILYQQTFGQ
jgi:hypothetical protein